MCVGPVALALRQLRFAPDRIHRGRLAQEAGQRLVTAGGAELVTRADGASSRPVRRIVVLDG
jgi:hypothetical protein